ncbi:MAG: hypothetical protein LW884_05090 [Bacteroidetes bacterium]|jgi:hypothetical protein|nr:hypothetical protein [Bacteroidota bacterium]
MNFSRHFVPLIATVALLLALWAAIQLWQLRHHLDQQTEALLEPEVELAVYMQQLHHYAQKLHWSGTAGNQQLASFYLHELEETEEKVLEAELMEDGQNISQLMRQHLSPTLKQMRLVVAQKDLPDFARHYQALLTGCNSCHRAAKHDFIQVQVPTREAFSGQVFE